MVACPLEAEESQDSTSCHAESSVSYTLDTTLVTLDPFT